VALNLKSLPTNAAKMEWLKMWLTPQLALIVGFILAASWEIVVGDGETRQLKTRESDGLPECAEDIPSLKTTGSARMANAPAVVACSMACTEHHQCRHFNYDKNDRQHSCHLYYKAPQNFVVRAHCYHYYTPGKSLSVRQCFISIEGVCPKAPPTTHCAARKASGEEK